MCFWANFSIHLTCNCGKTTRRSEWHIDTHRQLYRHILIAILKVVNQRNTHTIQNNCRREHTYPVSVQSTGVQKRAQAQHNSHFPNWTEHKMEEFSHSYCSHPIYQGKQCPYIFRGNKNLESIGWIAWGLVGHWDVATMPQHPEAAQTYYQRRTQTLHSYQSQWLKSRTLQTH